jgi:hypothetical protein
MMQIRKELLDAAILLCQAEHNIQRLGYMPKIDSNKSLEEMARQRIEHDIAQRDLEIAQRNYRIELQGGK